MDFDKISYDKNIITEIIQILGEYSFRLEDIPEIKIKIKIYKYYDCNDICFSLSHFIHTPTQASVYIPSSVFANTEEVALERAIKSITNFYDNAKKSGYIPEPSWLVENSNF